MMRIVFGVLSLLLVLAIVGSLASKQLRSVNGLSTRMNAAASEAQVALPAPDATAATAATVPQQAQNIEQQFRDRTAAALQQGVDRNERAAP